VTKQWILGLKERGISRNEQEGKAVHGDTRVFVYGFASAFFALLTSLLTLPNTIILPRVKKTT